MELRIWFKSPGCFISCSWYICGLFGNWSWLGVSAAWRPLWGGASPWLLLQEQISQQASCVTLHVLESWAILCHFCWALMSKLSKPAHILGESQSSTLSESRIKECEAHTVSPSLPYWGWKPPELSLLQQHILLSWIPVSIKVGLALKRRGRCWFGISHEQWVSSCAWGNRSNKKKPLKLHLDSTLTSIKMIYYLGNNCI